MSAATGPLCEGTCGKRVSARRVTQCPWCRRVLCLKCECPDRCGERFGHGPKGVEGPKETSR
jgi:hypothetical protein